jgi:uncharacterized protein YjbI with pentapeptide repeats
MVDRWDAVAGGLKAKDLTLRERRDLNAEATDLEDRMFRTVLIARTQLAEAKMRSALRPLLASALVAALGITLFAWAANPPDAPTVSITLRGAVLANANLRGADLQGVDLTGADLTGADLTGAVLKGAVLTNVVWKNTTCPDGQISDTAGGTCAGHF